MVIINVCTDMCCRKCYHISTACHFCHFLFTANFDHTYGKLLNAYYINSFLAVHHNNSIKVILASRYSKLSEKREG